MSESQESSPLTTQHNPKKQKRCDYIYADPPPLGSVSGGAKELKIFPTAIEHVRGENLLMSVFSALSEEFSEPTSHGFGHGLIR